MCIKNEEFEVNLENK